MRTPFRTMLIGSALLALQFVGWLVFFAVELPVSMQVLSGMSLFATCLVLYLISVHRTYAPMQQFMDSVSSVSSDRLKQLEATFPPDVRELAEVIREDQDVLAFRLKLLQDENEAIRSSRDAEQRSWRRQEEWFQQGLGSVEGAMEGSQDVQAVAARMITLSRDTAQVIEQLKAGQDAGLGLAEETVRRVMDIRQGQEKRVQKVIQIVKRFDEISEIMKRIHMITDQTKIISFNAGIEASSTADAGKRFSIVASDMRKLAQNLEDAYQEIKITTQYLRTSLDDVVAAALDGGEYVGQTVDRLEAFLQALRLMTEQTTLVLQHAGDLEAAGSQQQNLSSHVLAQLRAFSAAHGDMQGIVKNIQQMAHSVTISNLTDRSVP